MERQRYTITDENGKSVIAEKEASRFISIDEFAQHIAIATIRTNAEERKEQYETGKRESNNSTGLH